MKKFLLIAFVLFNTASFAQGKKIIDSFLGIKFGTTKAGVITALKAKGATLDNENSDKNMLVFDNISLADREATYLMVQFIDNKAYQAIFTFKPDEESETIKYYNDLVEDITTVYGKGVAAKEYTEWYKGGDGNEIEAIKSENAEYRTSWGMNEAKHPANILVLISKKLSVNISYRDKKLAALVAKRAAAQESDL